MLNDMYVCKQILYQWVQGEQGMGFGDWGQSIAKNTMVQFYEYWPNLTTVNLEDMFWFFGFVCSKFRLKSPKSNKQQLKINLVETPFHFSKIIIFKKYICLRRVSRTSFPSFILKKKNGINAEILQLKVLLLFIDSIVYNRDRKIIQNKKKQCNLLDHCILKI